MRRPPRSGADPRLLEAYALLRSALEEPADDLQPLAAEGAWEPAVPGDGDDWLVSSTDVLTPWSPVILAGGAGPIPDPGTVWDAYFALPPGGPETPPVLPRRAAAPPRPPADEPDRRPLSALGPPGLIEEPLDDETAHAAVQCLYDFVHALGRFDVEEAMAAVAGDYHAIEDDREVDREALRHRLEELLDAHRGGAVELSLAEIPEPLPFADGYVLIPAVLQIDRRPEGGPPATTLVEWIAVLAAAEEGFRICALSPRRARESAPLPGPEAARSDDAR